VLREVGQHLRMDGARSFRVWVDRWMRVVGVGVVLESGYLDVRAYRAWVLSSMGSPLVSCWPSASGGLVPFRVASLSARPRMRGNSKKSYTRAPIAPPIMGPTQYTYGEAETNQQDRDMELEQAATHLHVIYVFLG